MKKLGLFRMKSQAKYPYNRFYWIHSLKKSLFISFTLVLCLLATATLYYFLGIVRKANAQARENFQQMAMTCQNELEKILSSSLTAAQIAGYSNACQQFLLSDYPETVIKSKQAAVDAMTYITTFGDGFRDVVLMSNRGRKLTANNQYSEVITAALRQCNIEEDLVLKETVYSPVISYKDNQYIACLFPVYGTIDGYRYRDNQIIGGIVYRVDNIMDRLFLSNYEESVTVLLYQDTILGISRTLTAAENTEIHNIESGSYYTKIDGDRYYVYCRALNGTEWDLIYLLPWDKVSSAPARENNFLAMIIIASILIVALLMLGILIAIQRDIDGLTADIRLLGTERDQVKTPHINELQIISSTLNQTLLNLKEEHRKEQQLIDANYKAMFAQARAEMLAYRSQINPHFLFNTLEAARSFAHHYKLFPVERLIGSMSKMFQYSLYSPMLVPFRKELENLDAYLAVIETRFPNRYKVLKDISEDTYSWMLLSVLLQPIVENVVQHAFAGREHGSILIKARIVDNHLSVLIADNGIGMSAENLRAVQWKMKNSSGETASLHTDLSANPWLTASFQDISIGLTNIYRRLKLTFGDQADLTLHSKEGYYTVTGMVIPYIDNIEAFTNENEGNRNRST